MTYGEIIAILNKEYAGDVDKIFLSIEEKPIGSASIAQTHKAVLRNNENVVIKIQRPNVQDLMAEDITVLKSAIKLLHVDSIFSNIIDINAFLDEMYATALEEMDFIIESKHMKKFADYNKSINYLKQVKVYNEYCTKNVLVMEYIGE